MESISPRTRGSLKDRIWFGDALAVCAVLLLTVAIGLNRAVYDSWIVRHDILTAYLPWYTFLGQELREVRIPGWNPHQFSGTPFAGDPQSGWMYLPVMLPFSIFSPVAAFKVAVALELLIAGLSSYAFARVIGLRPVAAVMAAIVFEFGPLLYWTTYCCTVRAQLAPWIPLGLLGVELALRSLSWRGRIASWFVAGFSISQMFAGWLGQGALDGCLVVGSFLVFRALISPPLPGRSVRDRVIDFFIVGTTMTGLSIALGAAGLLPRLAVNPATNLSGGNYERLASGYSVHPYRFKQLIGFLLSDDYVHREQTLGGAVIVLALAAPFLARRHFGVPYFVGLTIGVYLLVERTTPLHHLFFLVPRWRVLHEHNAAHVTAVVGIGPAILAGATIQMLPSLRGHVRRVPLVFLPLSFVLIAAVWAVDEKTSFSWTTFAAAAVATVLLCLAVATPCELPISMGRARVARAIPVLLAATVFVQPTGMELVDAATGSSLLRGWTATWNPTPDQEAGIAIGPSSTDAGGVGEFLQERQQEEGPFRYFGYGGLAYPGDQRRGVNYTVRRLEPSVQALMVNGRSIFLGLHDIQGYNPVQLSRYVEFITAVNGKTQDYHHANIRPAGVDSPLLDLLNVRYVVVDASIPTGRDDIVALTAERHEVFRSDLVVVYESDVAPSSAWIVHDVTTVSSKDDALSTILRTGFDSRQQAVVEGSLPPLSRPASDAPETATITSYEPGIIKIATESAAPGLLVVSEVYTDGWVARVDGRKTPVLATDYVLRGIALPAGEHEIELRYEPLSLRIGVPLTAISTIAMLVSFGLVVWPRLRTIRRR